jgi:dihydroxyacetone kinase
MKKLINDVNHVVDEMTEGLAAAYPGLARLSGYNVLLRSDIAEVRNEQVVLISGGGSGHEPAHAGYIGAGMLSAAVAGEVFTSPDCDSIFAAIKAVAGNRGVLLIVKNYTGDRLNFGLAAEMARAEGILIEIVVVADDIALEETRRGIAGTVFVHKLAGAAAAEGRPLAEVVRVAQEAADAVATMGVSLSSGTVPAVGKPGFTLDETEVELGLGIHGEPGVQRVRLESADSLTEKLLDNILSASHISSGEEVALMINNLGATTTMELAIVARRALSYLRSRNITTKRVFMGTFMSSLEMAGISLSLLRLNKERLALLDAPTTASAWPNTSRESPSPVEERTIQSFSSPANAPSAPLPTQTGTIMRAAIEAACRALIDAQEQLTELDRVVGDGDLGITLARGSKEVLKALPGYPLADPSETLKALAQTLRKTMGGSSGPLYGVLFLRAGNILKDKPTNDAASWVEAIEGAINALSTLGGASAGDRTMLDALMPFSETFRAAIQEGASLDQALKAGVEMAQRGADATAQMKPKRGRSRYLGERTLNHRDPGAVAVALWLRAVIENSNLASLQSAQ